MRARFSGLCVALALLVGAARASAQCSPAAFEQKSITVLKQQAASGNAEAQCVLGMMYDQGAVGVPQDSAQAVFWLGKAAEQGEPTAQFNLGLLYETGQGVPKDPGQAAIWWRKAAEQGEPYSQFDLGLLYARGEGVPQDYEEAYFWLDLAAAGKLDPLTSKDARNGRETVASSLTPDELSRVQERARIWFEDHPAKP